MKPLGKVGLVAAGYLLALLLAVAVVRLHDATTSLPPADTSGGMYAFGDAMLFVVVFGVVALLPTAAALLLLRPYPRFWKVLAGLALTVAALGVVSVCLFAFGRRSTDSTLAHWGGYSVLAILAAPLLALAFLVTALLAPAGGARRALFAALAIEVAVVAYGGVIWFLPIFLEGP
ncbi:MAG TPA: hypothetical protein VMG41_10850 [Gemmatimonadales bacterium]|nr:hypothetical protein [Gemmatimonadales bacterium]